MSDHTGIFQHAIYDVPNYHEAYCTDDNARAFIFTVLLQGKNGHQTEMNRLASSYLAFLWYAFDANTCRFRNFMSHQRQWLELHGSEDSHARALWAQAQAQGGGGRVPNMPVRFLPTTRRNLRALGAYGGKISGGSWLYLICILRDLVQPRSDIARDGDSHKTPGGKQRESGQTLTVSKAW